MLPIVEWRKLSFPCEVCSKPAIIQVIYGPDPSAKGFAASFQTCKTYCAEHSPVDLEAEESSWFETLQTPPGS